MVIFVIVVYAQGPLAYCIEINIILSYLIIFLSYVNGSGSITSVGEERANLSAVVYL